MIEHQMLTRGVLLSVAVGLGLYDIVMWRYAPAATITSVLIAESMQAPVLPFILGFLCGHVFWRTMK